jgi:hypothetical protein
MRTRIALVMLSLSTVGLCSAAEPKGRLEKLAWLEGACCLASPLGKTPAPFCAVELSERRYSQRTTVAVT